MGFKPYKKLSIIACATEHGKAMGLFLIWCRKLLCMYVSKDLPRRKSVCDIKSGVDPRLSLARSCRRWWLYFITFSGYKKSRFGKNQTLLLLRPVQHLDAFNLITVGHYSYVVSSISSPFRRLCQADHLCWEFVVWTLGMVTARLTHTQCVSNKRKNKKIIF